MTLELQARFPCVKAAKLLRLCIMSMYDMTLTDDDDNVDATKSKEE
jgi:hypothetical protein